MLSIYFVRQVPATRPLRTIYTQAQNKNIKMNTNPFHNLEAMTNQGQKFQFSNLKGKVVLLVNVASKCKFTKQYKALQELQDKYGSSGLIVVGLPCNQFGKQEPGTPEEISKFVKENYDVTFPLLQKMDVNGANTCDIFQLLKEETDGKDVKWNFEKFLIDRNGEVVGRYESKITPEELEPTIRSVLVAAV